jgi:hypothetical protein
VVGWPPWPAQQRRAREAADDVEQGKGGRERGRQCGWRVGRLRGVGPSHRVAWCGTSRNQPNRGGVDRWAAATVPSDANSN